MTRGEAIMTLSSLMMQCGMLMPIEWVRQNGEGSPVYEAVIMAQNALREQEERSKGCAYCTRRKSLPIRNDLGQLWIENGRLNNLYGDCEIKFCPNCGRNLEVEE